MSKLNAYDLYADKYDSWFEENKYLYQSELEAVKSFIPKKGIGIDIGTGTGRFAVPFGIKTGIEPSKAMGIIATYREMKVIKGIAENLPLKNDSYDFALMITVTCYLNDLPKSLSEVYRILKPGGSFILSHIDKESFLGKMYLCNKEDIFLKDAVLYNTKDLLALMQKSGFTDLKINQTIFEKFQSKKKIQPVKEGFGEGAFVTICGIKM